MGKERKNRFDEFMLKFDKYDKPIHSEDACDLSPFFNYCMIVTDKTSGVDKKHYFDNKDNIPKILGNAEAVEHKGGLGVKIFNKEGKLTSQWEKIL